MQTRVVYAEISVICKEVDAAASDGWQVRQLAPRLWKGTTHGAWIVFERANDEEDQHAGG